MQRVPYASAIYIDRLSNTQARQNNDSAIYMISRLILIITLFIYIISIAHNYFIPINIIMQIVFMIRIVYIIICFLL